MEEESEEEAPPFRPMPKVKPPQPKAKRHKAVRGR